MQATFIAGELQFAVSNQPHVADIARPVCRIRGKRLQSHLSVQRHFQNNGVKGASVLGLGEADVLGGERLLLHIRLAVKLAFSAAIVEGPSP